MNIGGQVGAEFEHYSTVLIRLRDYFLARATVIAEVTVLRMQDNVNQVNAGLREMADEALAAGALFLMHTIVEFVDLIRAK